MCPMLFTAFQNQLSHDWCQIVKWGGQNEGPLENNMRADRWMESLFVKRSGNYTCLDYKRCKKKRYPSSNSVEILFKIKCSFNISSDLWEKGKSSFIKNGHLLKDQCILCFLLNI